METDSPAPDPASFSPCPYLLGNLWREHPCPAYFFLLFTFIAAVWITKLLFALRNRSVLNWLLLGYIYFICVSAIASEPNVFYFFEKNLGMHSPGFLFFSPLYLFLLNIASFWLVVRVIPIIESPKKHRQKSIDLKKTISSLEEEKLQLAQRLNIVEAGLKGELLVAGELEKLPDSYYISNDVSLSAEDKALQVDHVVVGPVGVLALETKYMSGLLQPFDEGILIKKGGNSQTVVRTEEDPRRQACFNAGKLSELLGMPVKPMVVISHPQGAWQDDIEESCPVLHLTNLLHYMLLELPRTMKDKRKAAAAAEAVYALDAAAAGKEIAEGK